MKRACLTRPFPITPSWAAVYTQQLLADQNCLTVDSFSCSCAEVLVMHCLAHSQITVQDFALRHSCVIRRVLYLPQTSKRPSFTLYVEETFVLHVEETLILHVEKTIYLKRGGDLYST